LKEDNNMYRDIQSRLSILAGKVILHREESEFNRDVWLSIKELKEMLTVEEDGLNTGNFFCPLCDSLIVTDPEEDWGDMIVKEKGNNDTQ
jgi:hypothetical protein